ncbi:hypothetical protein [Nocardia brasiliensis]
MTAIEEFLRAVCSCGCDGHAPDTRAVELVRSVIAHQQTVEAETSELGLAEDAAAYLAACANAVVPAETLQVESVPRPADEPVPWHSCRSICAANSPSADIAAAVSSRCGPSSWRFATTCTPTPIAYLWELRMHARHAAGTSA